MSNHKWSSKKTLLAQLEKLWDKGLILQAHSDGNSLFPLRLKFKSPTSQALTHEFDAVRAWVSEVQKIDKVRIVDKVHHHRIIGDNSLPCEAWIDTPGIAVELLNKRQQFSAFTQILSETQQRAPQLLDWINQYPLKALNAAQSWTQLLDFIQWRQQHPAPQIYLRQVNLQSIDSKFIEQHYKLLIQLLDLSLPLTQIDETYSSVRQFAQRYGFRSKPERVRFRLLDPELALIPADDNDCTLTANDFQAFLQELSRARTAVSNVFITENEVNFLAFPAVKNSLIIFGAGYGFDALARVNWLSKIDLIYWGDIDTHGFAILDQLRSKFPHVTSILMDEKTLMQHRHLWGQESTPKSRVLQRLTPTELALYQSLLADRHQEGLRLEQERIQYGCLITALADLGLCSKALGASE